MTLLFVTRVFVSHSRLVTVCQLLLQLLLCAVASAVVVRKFVCLSKGGFFLLLFCCLVLCPIISNIFISHMYASREPVDFMANYTVIGGSFSLQHLLVQVLLVYVCVYICISTLMSRQIQYCFSFMLCELYTCHPSQFCRYSNVAKNCIDPLLTLWMFIIVYSTKLV